MQVRSQLQCLYALEECELTSTVPVQWRTPGAQLRKASDGSEDTLSLNNAGGGNSAGSDQRNVSGGAWLPRTACSARICTHAVQFALSLPRVLLRTTREQPVVCTLITLACA